jgi:hypothetical protein
MASKLEEATMALLGSGVLAIWNGVEEGADQDFIEWHVLEHIPERVGIPGFLRGRRYIAVDGYPRYFNFYETENPDVLTSSPYRDRLNAPTDWTRQNIARFRDTCRTICSVAATQGLGEGAWIETLRFTNVREPEAFRSSVVSSVVPSILVQPGIVGVHLLEGEAAASQGASTEKTLRGQPDEIADWVLLIEAVEEASLRRVREGTASDRLFREAASTVDIVRGFYRLQFALTKSELDRGSVAPKRWVQTG